MKAETLRKVIERFVTSEYPEVSHVRVIHENIEEDITAKIYIKKGFDLKPNEKELIRNNVRSLFEMLNPEEEESLIILFVKIK